MGAGGSGLEEPSGAEDESGVLSEVSGSAETVGTLSGAETEESGSEELPDNGSLLSAEEVSAIDASALSEDEAAEVPSAKAEGTREKAKIKIKNKDKIFFFILSKLPDIFNNALSADFSYLNMQVDKADA